MDLKKWPIYTMKYYSDIKRKEILTHATMWINLEDVRLSGLIQSQMGRHCMSPLL